MYQKKRKGYLTMQQWLTWATTVVPQMSPPPLQSRMQWLHKKVVPYPWPTIVVLLTGIHMYQVFNLVSLDWFDKDIYSSSTFYCQPFTVFLTDT